MNSQPLPSRARRAKKSSMNVKPPLQCRTLMAMLLLVTSSNRMPTAIVALVHNYNMPKLHHHHHPMRSSRHANKHYYYNSILKIRIPDRHVLSVSSSSNNNNNNNNSNNAWKQVFQAAIGNLDNRLDTRNDMKQRQRQRRHQRSSKNGSIPNENNNNSNFYNTNKKSRIEFISPLLEDGYPPAVLEYEQQQRQSRSRRRYAPYDNSNNNNNNNNKKPILLYLPGFDGTILAPFLQFPSLGEEFDVRAMKVDMEDRSTFEELKEAVIHYLLIECDENTEDNEELEQGKDDSFVEQRETGVVYLMGESFGGILATEIALELNRQMYNGVIDLRGLILVNPATSYLRSNLYELGPPIANAKPFLPALQDAQYVLSLVTQLVPLFLDKGRAMRQLIIMLSSRGLPSVVNNPQREAYMGRVAFDLPNRLKFMPKDTLQWRLEEWLEWGCGVFEDRVDMLHSARDVASTASGDDIESSYSILKLSQELRTLIVVGEFDLTLPSIEEATRLSTDVFRNARVHIVPGAGHASTCGGSLNLIQLLREVFPEINVHGGGMQRSFGDGLELRPNEELNGLEPRYDGASIGLNPLLYWSKEYYRKWR